MNVTFTRTRQAVTDSTDRVVPTTSSITGNAIMVRGKPERYRALSLDLSTMPTLLFTPDSYPLLAFTSESVQPGDKCTWNGEAYTVKDFEPVGPDGSVIIGRVVIAK